MALAVVLLAGCGGEDFKNEARAPIRLELSGVIQDDEVTVSPAKLGAGPVAPGDTTTIQKTLEPGSYEVKAGSTKAVTKEIRPAVLQIGKSRKNSNNDVLLP